MIQDAQVQVTCDGDGCDESILIDPPYVYTSYSGKDGHYDTSNSALWGLIEGEDWKVVDGLTYCETHAPEEPEDEQE
jgi:hypothetical protein